MEVIDQEDNNNRSAFYESDILPNDTDLSNKERERNKSLNISKLSHQSQSPHSLISRNSLLQSTQEHTLKKQAKKLFELGQGGISLPGLSYLSSKVHSPAERKSSIIMVAQFTSPKPLNETCQEKLNKQFPCYQFTNVNDFDNKIDFFQQVDTTQKQKNFQNQISIKVKPNIQKHRKKDNQLDMIQLQGNDTFIQPQFMQERGSMCITELWQESMKKEIGNLYSQNKNKMISANNLRLMKPDKGFMSIFRPEKQKKNVDIYQSAVDNNSNMVLSKFGEKNILGSFGLMNENASNKKLIRQKSGGLNSPSSNPISDTQTPTNEEDSIIDDTNTPSKQKYAGKNIRSPKSQFFSPLILPNIVQNYQSASNNIRQQQQLQEQQDQNNNQSNTSTPIGRLNKSNISFTSSVKSFKRKHINKSLFTRNTQDLVNSKNKLDFLKAECEEELQTNIQIEKTIKTNLNSMNTKLSSLLKNLS